MTTFNIMVAKTGQSFEIDFEQYPEATRNYIIAYGLKQKFNDCHVSGENTDEKSALVDKTFAALMSGEIRIGAARATDRLGSEIKRLATSLAKDKYRKDIGKLPKDYGKDPDFVEYVRKYSANKKVIAKARENITALADIEL